MFSVTNSTWTLLAIVPSSTVCVCEFFRLRLFFYFNFACVCARVSVQSKPLPFTSILLSVCVDIKCVLLVVLLCLSVCVCVGICYVLFVSSHSLPQHEAQNQSTRDTKAAHGATQHVLVSSLASRRRREGRRCNESERTG